MRSVRLTAILGLLPGLALAQEVANTSYLASNGEKVLRIECTLHMGKTEAWKLFTTEAGLRKWIAPVVAVDFRVGGRILTNYGPSRSVRDPGTISLPIINYLDGQMLTLKVILNREFPAKVRREGANLQEIIQLEDVGDGQTHIVSSMVGWGIGSEWDKTYAFFEKGNAWTYRQLVANSQS
ncbi:MAG TPA: hypothetical protein VGL55_02535 [Steroidobacteraceae bacterium]|jgi:hypothetical protein